MKLEVLIEIDYDIYEDIKRASIFGEELSSLEEALVNGVQLPMEHGKLGDLDYLAKRIKAKPPIGDIGRVTLEECYQEVLNSDGIIKAKDRSKNNDTTDM